MSKRIFYSFDSLCCAIRYRFQPTSYSKDDSFFKFPKFEATKKPILATKVKEINPFVLWSTRDVTQVEEAERQNEEYDCQPSVIQPRFVHTAPPVQLNIPQKSRPGPSKPSASSRKSSISVSSSKGAGARSKLSTTHSSVPLAGRSKVSVIGGLNVPLDGGPGISLKLPTAKKKPAQNSGPAAKKSTTKKSASGSDAPKAPRKKKVRSCDAFLHVCLVH